MPNLEYKDDSINPETGTPQYYNINEKTPTINWKQQKRGFEETSPIVEPVGNLFDQAGGIETIDKNLTSWDLEDIPEARAQIQSVGDRLGKILPRITNKILEETIKLPGELYGMGEWLAEGADVKKFGDTINNEWVKGVAEIAEAVNEDILPIYTPRSVQNGNLWDNITSASFWATEGADGIGFLASMMLPGQFIKAAKFGQAVTKLGKSAKVLAEGDVYLAKTAKNINTYAATVVNTTFESISEGLESVKGAEQTLYKNKFDELMKSGQYDPQQAADIAAEYIKTPEAKKIAGEAGYHTFMANLPILMASNALDQKWLFNGFGRGKALSETGEVLQKRLGKSIGNTSGEFLGDVVRLTGKEKALRVAKIGAAGVVKEGFFEEGLQFSSSKYYQDKAVKGEDTDFLQDIEGNIDTYLDSLGQTDMQKSIFLGAVMGGGMGMIGGANQAKLEDRMLFGDEGRTPSKVERFFGLQGREERKGLVNLLKDNFDSHYSSFESLLARDENGNYLIEQDENGENRLKLDPAKVSSAAKNKINESMTKSLLKMYQDIDNKEGFDAVKNEYDLKYMLPYLQEEGGYELLKEHINRMAEEDTKLLQSLGVDTKSSQEVKQDLLKKADTFKRLYDGVEKTMSAQFTGKETKSGQLFNSVLVSSAFMGEAKKDFLNNKVVQHQRDLNQLLSGENMNNTLPIETASQLRKGQLISNQGKKQVIISRKGEVVRLRNTNGEVEEVNAKELLDRKPEVFFSVPVAQRNEIFNKSELLQNSKDDLLKTSKDVELLYSKKGQQELFDDFQNELKKDEELIKEAEEKATKEAVKKAKTPEEINKVVQQAPNKKVAEKAINKQVDDEMAAGFSDLSSLTNELNPDKKKDEPNIDDSNVQEGEPKIVTARRLYKNSPAALKAAVETLSVSISEIVEDQEKSDRLHEYLSDPTDGNENFLQFLEDAARNRKPMPLELSMDYTQEELDNLNEKISTHISEYYEGLKQRRMELIKQGFGEKPTVDNSIIPSNDELDNEDSTTFDNILGGANAVAVDTSGEYVLNHHVKFDFNESKKEKGHKHKIVYKKDGTPEEYSLDNDYAKELKAGLQAIANGKLQDKDGNVRKDLVVNFEVDTKSEYNQGKRKRLGTDELISINETNLQIQVVTYLDGERIVLGMLPNYSASKQQHKGKELQTLRTNIYNEVHASKQSRVQSKFVTNLEEILPGKIQRTSQKAANMHSPSKVANGKKFFLTTVVSKGEILVHDTERIPSGIVEVTSANDLQNGAIYMWMEHPILKGRWFPIRAFTKKLKETPDVKKEVIDLIRSIKTPDDYIRVRDQIRSQLARIDFLFDKQGRIVPKENGIVKEDMAMEPSEVGTKFPTWLDDASVQINKNNLNINDAIEGNSNLSHAVDDRLRLNVAPGEPFFLMNARISLDNIREADKKPKIGKPEGAKVVTKETIVKEPEVQQEEFKDLGKALDELISLREKHGENRKALVDEYVSSSMYNSMREIISDKLLGEYFWNREYDKIREYLNIELKQSKTKEDEKETSEKRETNQERLLAEKELDQTPAPISMVELDNITDLGDLEGFGEDITLDEEDSHPRIATEDVYTVWNEQEEREWFTKNFPNVPIEALENLREATKYGKNLWGLFKNATVYIAKDAAVGTTYHEAFHVVFNMYLTEKQRQSLLKGATEEQRADQFMDYIMTEMEDKSLGSRITSFFKYLWAVIKRIATGNIDIDEVFYRANHGMYKNSPLTRDINDIKTDERPRERIPGWTARREKRAASILNNYIINEAVPKLRNLRTVDGTLVHPEYQDLTDVDVLKTEGIGKVYKEIVGTLLKSYISQKDPAKKKATLETLNALARIEVVDGKPVFKGYNLLYDIALKELINYGITIKGSRLDPNSQKISENSLETDSEESANFDQVEEQEDLTVGEDEIGHIEAYQLTNQEKSTKVKTSYLVKKYIRNLAQIDSKTGLPIKDETGLFTVPVKYDEFYDTLMKDVSDSLSVKEMIDTLEDLSVFRPEYKTIINSLRADHEFATAFFNTFNKPMQLQIFASEGQEGDFIISEANRKTIRKIVIEDWASGVVDRGIVNDSEGTIDQERVKAMFDYVSKLANRASQINDVDILNLSVALNNFGMFIKPEVFKYLKKNKQLGNALTQLKIVLNAFKDKQVLNKTTKEIETIPGSNVFDPTSTSREDKAINMLANFVKKGDQSLSESSHSNVSNKTVYAHLEGNYMIRRILRLAKDEESFNKLKEEMSQDEVTASFLQGFEYYEGMRFAILDGLRYANQYNGVDYTKMDPVDLNVTVLNMFRNNGSQKDAMYRIYTLSDAPVMSLIQYQKRNTQIETTVNGVKVVKSYTDKKGIVERLTRVAIGEIKRIDRLQKRAQGFKDGTLDSRLKINNYDSAENLSVKTGFKMLPFLNGKVESMPNFDMNNAEAWKSYLRDNKIREHIYDYLEKQSSDMMKELLDQEIIEEKDKKINIVRGRLSSSIMKEYASVKDFIDDFVYNDYYVRTQMVAIGMGDIAFYAKDKKGNNNVVDPQKRSKETVSPKSLIDATAFYEIKDSNGRTVDKIYAGSTYKSFYLKDSEFYSPIATDIYQALIKGKEGDPKARKRALMIAINYGYYNFSYEDPNKGIVNIAVDNPLVDSVEYTKQGPVFRDKDEKLVENVEFFNPRKINQTDGQAYITMDFYRRTMIGMQRWNPKLQNSYDRIMNRKGTLSDISLVTESFTLTKPFMYTQTQQTQNGQVMNIPVQHKNSEYILIPQLVEQADEKLQKVYNMMLEKGVDIMNFESAVKVGGFAAEDIESVDNPIIHEFQMIDRGMQQEVPEHYLDTESNFGTQIRKHIMAGLGEGTYKVDGKEMSSTELFEFYNNLLTENILESFRELERELYDVKKTTDEAGNITTTRTINIQKVKNILLEEIRSRNKGAEYEEAVELVTRNGKLDFALPLSHPTHGRVVESLLNAIFKNRITKQKINGGAFVQVSNFGFTDKLKVKIDVETGSLQYMEVMLPWWSREMFERYQDENGNINIAKIEEEEPELLKGIGYRIPTEDKYSMVPLKIVGFLPQEAGGAVMLPAEITTIAGSDFDIDKLYIMLKERVKATDLSVTPSFNAKLESEYETYKANLIAEKDIKSWDEKRGRVTFASSKDVYWDDEQQKWFYKKDDARSKKFKVAQYNYSRPASQNSRAARNNAIIDVMYGVLTNPNTLTDFINPGGYSTLSSLAERLSPIFESKTERDFMTAKTQNELAIANMVGKSLVGVAANHTANYSIRLHTNLSLVNGVKFDGHSTSSIHSQTDYRGSSIGKNLAEFLAAIVDNAKDPVASYIFYNGYTADIISLLVSSGVPLETAIAFINQPILRNFIAKAIKGGLSKQKSLLNKFAEENGKLDPSKAMAFNLSTEELWDMLEGKIEDKTVKADLERRVVSSFLQYRRQADDLGTLIRSMRGDTTGGSAGPSIAESERKIGFIEKALELQEIGGVEEIFPTKDIEGTNRIELVPERSNVKWLATFIQTGLIEADKFLEAFFPYSKPGFKHIKDRIELFKGSPLTVKEINMLNSNIMSFAMSGHSFYTMTDEEKAYYIYEFPTEFFKLKKSKEYGEYLTYENGMTQRLKLEQKNLKIGKDFQSISYDNTNSFSNNQSEDIKTDFLDLLQSENPTLRKLGLDLIKYAFVTSGFNFGPNSFFQMIPVEFYTKVLPGLNGQDLNTYIDKIMQESESDNIFYDGFMSQFYRNMWKRTTFVPVVETDEKGNPLHFNIDTKTDGSVEFKFKIENEEFVGLSNYQVGKKGTAKEYIPFLLAKVTQNKKTRDALLVWNKKTNSYVETNKLGVPNYVLEYNRNATVIKSAVKSNNSFKPVKVGTTKIVPVIATVSKPIKPVVEESEAGSTNISDLMPKKEAPKGRIVEIEKDKDTKFHVVVLNDGTVIYQKTGKPLDPVKDIKLINKAKLKSGYYKYTKVHVDSTNADYAVVHHDTEGTKVISLANSNMGGEINLTTKVAQEALSKAPTKDQTQAKKAKDNVIATTVMNPKKSMDAFKASLVFTEENNETGDPNLLREESLTEKNIDEIANNENQDLDDQAEENDKNCKL